ncbi:Response regulator protein VraR [Calidithermus terrae]|uniref:Response regulator protein VraR n=1 Tax=Calidithermus terrae TaxID=1408545 RepID=A0A399EEZ0_9DEIN|nr:response regulator transcription factor [Calidithermus terrae]RIH81719.1 Response regulator protein VraR [Calidithermus terrae]
MKASEAVSVVVADAYPVVLSGCCRLIASNPRIKVRGHTTRADDLLALVGLLRPQVLVTDLNFPGVDGAELVAAARERSPQTQVLVFSDLHNHAAVLRVLQAGACSFLLKESSAAELTEAILATAAGKSCFSPPIAGVLLESLRKPALEPISAREGQILTLVARGLSNQDIARELGIAESTVKTHLVRLFAKLEVQDRTAAIVVALQRNLIRLEKPGVFPLAG